MGGDGTARRVDWCACESENLRRAPNGLSGSASALTVLASGTYLATSSTQGTGRDARSGSTSHMTSRRSTTGWLTRWGRWSRVKAELAETEAKYKVFELWAKKAELSQGGASSSDLKAVDVQIAAAELKVQKVAGEPVGKVSVSKLAATAAGDTTVTPMAFPTPAEARSLTLTHSSRSNGYYCAPASTAMVIRVSGGSETSRYNSGHKMSQTRLASSTYLATSSSQGTSMHRVPITLQRWMGLSTDVYAGPTATKLKNLTAGAIGVLGHGVEYGTHETAGAKHYNNHPANRGIDHYIAGFGYSSNGSNVKWADPATSIWSGLATKGNMSASTMAGFVSRFGIIA
jgi:hypothetical protein